MADAPVTEAIVCAAPEGPHEFAVVVKRTFSIRHDGRCVPADEQIPIIEDFPAWEAVDPPFASPPRWDSDLSAFKRATDVVVQGHAYSYYGEPTVDCELLVGQTHRVVRVHGDRRLERHEGKLRITPGAPFERIPLRYDRAYGGFDAASYERDRDPQIDTMNRLQPELNMGTSTRFHYPRNPSGVGFIVHGSPMQPQDLPIPNFEFPWDPLTLRRMAVNRPQDWMDAPIPAGFDWWAPEWFPRLAYLGVTPDHAPRDGPPPEAALGWVPPGILASRPIYELGWNPQFFQGASPGLTIPRPGRGTTIVLRNLFPGHPERRITLPPIQPVVQVRVSAVDVRQTTTQLNSVVIQPDDDRLILVWSARCAAPRPFHESELGKLSWTLGFA